MKNIINTFLFGIILFLSTQLNAQDGYTYTLIDNGSYSYTIEVVPNTSTSNFSTLVQSYGFTIILPDGETANITSSLGSGAGATFFDGNNVGNPSIDGYLITETLGSPVSLPAPSAATNTPVVTIQLNGTPTSGMIYILANDSSLATNVNPLQSFMSADMIDDGMTAFENVVNTNPSGLSGTTSYDFATLSVTEQQSFEQFSVYPNPMKAGKGKLNFNWLANNQSVDFTITDINGRIVEARENIFVRKGTNTIKLSKINAGVYFAQFYFDNNRQIITKKIIVQ